MSKLVQLTPRQESYLLQSVRMVAGVGLGAPVFRTYRPEGSAARVLDELVRRHFMQDDRTTLEKGVQHSFVATEQGIRYLLRRGLIDDELARSWRLKRAAAVVNR